MINSQTDVQTVLQEKYNLDSDTATLFLNFTNKHKGNSVSKNALRQSLQKHKVAKEEQKRIFTMLKKEKSLSKKIERLETMKKYFGYWHVAHMPFALIMLIIVVVHVVVAFTFGYKWIF